MAKRKLKRFAIGALGVLLALMLVLALTGVWMFRRSFPVTGGELAVPGLSAPVTVRRDGSGVPHLTARTADDLFRAQGYVSAQDRFWEMDVRRHITAGRLSEMFGPGQVQTDRFVRTLGWRRVAQEEWDRVLDADTKRWLMAYTDGVNAYLKDKAPSELSAEYAVLGLTNGGYRPEPWTPVDSVAWLKAMAWDLRGNMANEVTRTVLDRAVGPTRTDELFPPYDDRRYEPILPDASGPATGQAPAGQVPAVPAPSGLAPTPIDEGGAAAVAAAQRAVDTVPWVLGPPGTGVGSNSWVVGGDHTTTGKPLLHNDPHLGASMPSIWWQVGLHCAPKGPDCPFDVEGFAFAGVPGVVIGHNDRVGWGFTNLDPDVTDLVIERVQDDRVEVGSGPDGQPRREPLRIIDETIKVAGGADVPVRIRLSANGPLLSDADRASKPAADGTRFADLEPGNEVALRWTALLPGHTMDSLFDLNRAANWADFQRAATRFEAPSQNLLYVDVDGNFGYQAPGNIPIRSGYDGRRPALGWDPRQRWTGFIPPEQMPSSYNPPRGFIVTANNKVLPNANPLFIHSDPTHGFRSQRLVDLVGGAVRQGKVGPDQVAGFAFDNYNPNAANLVPVLFGVDGLSPGASKARDLARGWDFQQPTGSAAGAWFNSVFNHLQRRTLDDDLPEAARADGSDRYMEVFRLLIAKPDAPWWDRRDTPALERRDDILRLAMEDAATELTARLGPDPARWTWGDVHRLTLTHQTLGKSGIKPIEALFNRGPVPVAGGRQIVNATGQQGASDHQVRTVPSMRMLLDPADWDRSRWINLTGVSGHAFHPHYWDQTEEWRTGRHRPMPFTPGVVERSTRATLRLVPGR